MRWSVRWSRRRCRSCRSGAWRGWRPSCDVAWRSSGRRWRVISGRRSRPSCGGARLYCPLARLSRRSSRSRASRTSSRAPPQSPFVISRLSILSRRSSGVNEPLRGGVANALVETQEAALGGARYVFAALFACAAGIPAQTEVLWWYGASYEAVRKAVPYKAGRACSSAGHALTPSPEAIVRRVLEAGRRDDALYERGAQDAGSSGSSEADSDSDFEEAPKRRRQVSTPVPSSSAAAQRMRATIGGAGRRGGAALSASYGAAAGAVARRRAKLSALAILVAFPLRWVTR